ncbi:HTTM domain-containing protein [Corallococcus macrosporus]|uniref:Vitamin K-dependent gamma-carboxylase-related protein n=1 Tax=Myxococcus fulvus (strain ATCC BAA-855 / HW-1) TaxID=483219 RepID=F8CCF1_MYXFH|nr:HTTM domain-containing protein [Corallococcus macrosporus]AEI68485.1 vitamin K-dependent gamma-carboxylase-related protein [Corallococcus macrosporus]
MTEVAPGARSASARLWRALLAPRDLAALVAFRVALGLLVTVSAVRFLAYGWVDVLFTGPRFHFTYWGFGWVPALPAPWMHAVFAALAVLGLCMAAGLFYRVAVALLFVTFTYVQLVDVSNYLNHYYLVSLLLGLMLFVPAHRGFSVDAWRTPALRSDWLPAWCTWLLRFQVGVVYVFAGLAKLTSDWLVHAQPLNIWLSARTSLPVVGPLLAERWVAYAAAWSGFLFDTFIVAFLLTRRLRPFAYVVVIGFHAATSALFPIGMFPVIMVTGALVFFEPSWPRRLVQGLRTRFARVAAAAEPPAEPASTLAPGAPGWKARAALGLAVAYAVVQVAVPLRTHLYGGNVLWHEQGMRFSWRVMAREKNGSVTFIVRDPASDREWHVTPTQYLTRLQEREMSVQPDLILQLARHIARDFEARGKGRVQVHVDALVSLNGRPAERLVDPDVDLAQEVDGLAPKRWIRPAPDTPPIRLHSPLRGATAERL